MQLTLIGIGTGNPEHLTLQAIRAINAQDMILIPRKGAGKADLAELRRAICDEVLTNPTTRIVEFDLPVRDEATPDYRQRVDDWHDAIALAWVNAMGGTPVGKVALLVWGDPSLYDSTLRIAARLDPAPQIEVIPGITSLQALTAAHAIPINDIGAPFVVTTGRRLRDGGWPVGVDTLAIMLDGACAFQTLPPEGVHIWWGGYVGMKEQITCEGPLAEVSARIIQMRAEARESHGWIMDIYILRKV
ncbi:precorrin-6A synthase (deacetylating) [Sulfitobacter geojensis]|uniref:Precorrin-6A synthase [deacetylating] n=1 Tax=Sulfitobacter geojensis TaxID=1342299 RepID=A0AAE2VY81_9RHOB|nr:precorrin-6A synthase (deacetylating) [Sulfitobacter geojensis]MBM1689648.1 precorrin-6A synthase (deacetylating) [Sulfitobacter geojensis]MBM1693714.1 precorrin-6A synthase (deacetylating) [Sulfitobacter geojensis]MBM1705880.1 precorrin-6A synthase (deacetylating) [Sulfitobacter geojensis]MBM1709938.1 precorrin-6A synthase (deacetylating) [Sulfitobacter geojensis]MBM1714004.1 precorrin-6A synthase (deacetylating) [Sulfitobacter geojensis]